MRGSQSCSALIPFLPMPFLSVSIFLGSQHPTLHHLSIHRVLDTTPTQAASTKKLPHNIQTETVQQESVNSPQHLKTEILGHVKVGDCSCCCLSLWHKIWVGPKKSPLPENNKLHILIFTPTASTKCLYLIFILGELICHKKCFCLYLSSSSCYPSSHRLASVKCNYTAFRKERRPAIQKGILPGASKFMSLQSSAGFCSA